MHKYLTQRYHIPQSERLVFLDNEKNDDNVVTFEEIQT